MSIYDEIGGKAAVAAAVDGFYGRVLHDDLLAPWFAGTDMARQKTHVRAFLAAALGGPTVYAARDMRAAHRGLGVTDAAFDRVVEHLVATLTDLDVPAALIAGVGATLAPLRDLVVARAVAA
jgi:hemoglobin